MYWKLNLRGIKKADHIITISEFSKKEIVALTGIEEDKISVIYPGIDTNALLSEEESLDIIPLCHQRKRLRDHVSWVRRAEKEHLFDSQGRIPPEKNNSGR